MATECQEGGDQSDAQESPDPQDAQEKHKSPPRPKKKSKKKVKVVHSKEYKIRWPKKCWFLRNALCVVNLLIHSWSLICTLSRCTNIDSCAALGNVAKHLVAWKLKKKKHMLRHGEMKYSHKKLSVIFVTKFSPKSNI